MIYVCHMESPVGRLRLESEGEAIVGIYFPDHRVPRHRQQPEDAQAEEHSQVPVLLDATRQLQEYFGGWRQQFDLPLAPQGTDFQKQVWDELRQIPFGQSISYGELARRIGNEKAVRAVGLANGRNPISLVVPCHRVIGANGSLTGYGGGLERKAFLLKLEGCSEVNLETKHKRGRAKNPGPMLPFGPGNSDGGSRLS
jgi:methylated-DNA-[protein]-cysteine S-methyltransferase